MMTTIKRGISCCCSWHKWACDICDLTSVYKRKNAIVVVKLCKGVHVLPRQVCILIWTLTRCIVQCHRPRQACKLSMLIVSLDLHMSPAYLSGSLQCTNVAFVARQLGHPTLVVGCLTGSSDQYAWNPVEGTPAQAKSHCYPKRLAVCR